MCVSYVRIRLCVIPCRVSRMFEIIVEYPESKPALLELKVHLEDIPMLGIDANDDLRM